jgi:hypothetical protein
MCVIAVHGERQLVCHGFADKARARIEDLLYCGCCAGFDARHRQYKWLPAARGVARHVKQVFHAEAQATQWPG